MHTITTERCLLRRWREDDLDAFAAINTDSRVLAHLPGPLTRDESAAMIARIEAGFREHGFGLWCVEVTEPERRAPCIGFVGLQVPRFEAHFTPCVEIGWRLAPSHWGVGLATEAARAALDDAFERCGLDEVVSFTVHANRPSWAVMERLGMTRDPAEDFDHPLLPPGDRLSRQRLYRIARVDRRRHGRR